MVNIVEAIHYRRAIEYTKMGCVEVAFKVEPNFENVKWALKQVFKQVKTYARRGEYPMNVVMNVRFINNSNCWALTASEKDTPATSRSSAVTSRANWKRFSGQVARDWLTLPQARPHWAKEFQHIPDIIPYIKKSYGENIAALQSDQGSTASGSRPHVHEPHFAGDISAMNLKNAARLITLACIVQILGYAYALPGHDELRQIVEGPGTIQRIDAGPELGVAEVDLLADLDQALAGRDLLVDRDRVLEVAEQDVGLLGHVGDLGAHLLVGCVEERNGSSARA